MENNVNNVNNVSLSEQELGSEEMELIALWKAFRAGNPEGSLMEFYETMSSIDQEG